MSTVLTDKKILILGGSSGIGLAVAQHACDCGACVTIASRNATKCNAILSKLPEKLVKIYDLDITAPTGYTQLFERIGDIDHLIITVRPEIDSMPFQATDIQKAKQAFETKFWGQYHFIQVAQDYIKESIILTSGIAGEKIYRGASIMAIINSATETLCKFLAVELAPLRVNAVSPGFVEPKPEAVQAMANQFPIKRLASLDEIASSYLWLMGNKYVTGAVTVMDGGARLI